MAFWRKNGQLLGLENLPVSCSTCPCIPCSHIRKDLNFKIQGSVSFSEISTGRQFFDGVTSSTWNSDKSVSITFQSTITGQQLVRGGFIADVTDWSYQFESLSDYGSGCWSKSTYTGTAMKRSTGDSDFNKCNIAFTCRNNDELNVIVNWACFNYDYVWENNQEIIDSGSDQNYINFWGYYGQQVTCTSKGFLFDGSLGKWGYIPLGCKCIGTINSQEQEDYYQSSYNLTAICDITIGLEGQEVQE